MSCPWVISHMMTMSPNLISLFRRDLFYVLADVCLYSAVSRWVTWYVVASPLWHVVIGISCWLFSCFQRFLFWLENTMYCLVSWSNDPRGPGRRLEYKRRQHAPLPALPMPGAGCCAQYHTTVSPNLDTVCGGRFSWRPFWQTLERSRSAGPSMLVR